MIKSRKEKKGKVMNSRTRTSKSKAQEEYSRINQEVRKSIKKDKQNYVETLAEEAQAAANSGNMKQLYITRKLSGKYNKTERPVKDKEGNAIITKDQLRTMGWSTLKNS